MFGFIAYAGVCFFAALLLTLLTVVLKPMRSREELRPGMTLLKTFLIATILPYLFVEGMTRTVGTQMKAGVADGFAQANIDGPMLYYKTLYAVNNKALVYAVGREKQDWGGYDRPVVSLELHKNGNTWETTNWTIIQSDRLGRESIYFPPYW